MAAMLYAFAWILWLSGLFEHRAASTRHANSDVEAP